MLLTALRELLNRSLLPGLSKLLNALGELLNRSLLTGQALSSTQKEGVRLPRGLSQQRMNSPWI